MTKFDRDTAVEPVGPGRYRARFDPGWWIVAGPNGGYMAAVILRALSAAVGDPARAPRSLTVHYARRPEGHDVEIATRVEREGRSASTVTARVEQGDRLVALAVAAFSKPRPGMAFQHARPPEVWPLERAAPPGVPTREVELPFHRQLEVRWAIPETPWSGAARARSTAWVRLREPRAVEAPLLALLADALPPAVFAVARERGGLVGAVPTLDLTVHFRAPLPHPGLADDAWLLLDFTTRKVADGFLEEDGELWAPDGTLLAQSRQLALLG